MANHASAEKSIRKIKKTTERNRTQRSALRTAIRKTREATAAGTKENLAPSFDHMQTLLMRAARKNLLHKNKMRRLISRAAKKLKAL